MIIILRSSVDDIQSRHPSMACTHVRQLNHTDVTRHTSCVLYELRKVLDKKYVSKQLKNIVTLLLAINFLIFLVNISIMRNDFMSNYLTIFYLRYFLLLFFLGFYMITSIYNKILYAKYTILFFEGLIFNCLLLD